LQYDGGHGRTDVKCKTPPRDMRDGV